MVSRWFLRWFPCFAVSGTAAENIRDAVKKVDGLGYERSAFSDARNENSDGQVTTFVKLFLTKDTFLADNFYRI